VALLRWGILGTARINRLIIAAIRASARSVVHAVASRDGDRASTYAALWSIPHAFASYDELLAADLDILYISLPNSLHVPWTLRAIEAGLHVLCEKPLALAPDDVQRISTVAAQRARVVTEGFMYRYHAQTERVAELISGGAVGSIQTLVGGFTYLQNRADDVRLDPSLGGGALWDVGCYPVSFGQWLAGARPASVIAAQRVGPTMVDEHFAGTVMYANDVILHFNAGFRAVYDTLMRVIGTEGVLEIQRPYRPDTHSEIIVRRADAIERIDIAGNAPFVDQIIDMEDAVIDGRPGRVTLEESRVLAATLVALHDAAKERRAIDVAI
jgi:predicted dehydrogenase